LRGLDRKGARRGLVLVLNSGASGRSAESEVVGVGGGGDDSLEEEDEEDEMGLLSDVGGECREVDSPRERGGGTVGVGDE
jgi:hypothetical protein